MTLRLQPGGLEPEALGVVTSWYKWVALRVELIWIYIQGHTEVEGVMGSHAFSSNFSCRLRPGAHCSVCTAFSDLGTFHVNPSLPAWFRL